MVEEYISLLHNSITNDTKTKSVQLQAIQEWSIIGYTTWKRGFISTVNKTEDWNVKDTTFVRLSLAVSPVNGYFRDQNTCSNIFSFAWLEWLRYTQNALNGVEHKVPGTNYR